MKRVRLDLQSALGLGDVFGEGLAGDTEECAPIHKKSRDLGDHVGREERAGMALRVARLIGDLVGSQEQVQEVLLLRDLRVNSQLPQDKAYVELGMWHKVERATRAAQRSIEKGGTGRQKKKKRKQQQEFQERYLESVAQWFADDLDEIRRREANFDERSMQMMADALRAGEDVWTEEERALLN